jgi:hypothetical protein
MAGNTLRIEVTAEDIKNGIPEGGDTCPVALAVKRTTNATSVWVEPSIALVCYSLGMGGGCGFNAQFRLPKRMVEWIDAFDDGRPVEPTYMTVVLRDVSYLL